MQGFSQEMVTEAQQKLKINKVLNQCSCSWTYSYQTSTIPFKLRERHGIYNLAYFDTC